MDLGSHLLMAARVERVEYDHQHLMTVLEDIARRFGMTPVAGNVYDHHWGPSGGLMISESHLWFDYFYGDTEYPVVTVDFFSCKPFDVQAASSMIVDKFHMIGRPEQYLVVRGRTLGESIVGGTHAQARSAALDAAG